MEDPRIISALFIFLKMAYYNVLINNHLHYEILSAIKRERCDNTAENTEKYQDYNHARFSGE